MRTSWETLYCWGFMSWSGWERRPGWKIAARFVAGIRFAEEFSAKTARRSRM